MPPCLKAHHLACCICAEVLSYRARNCRGNLGLFNSQVAAPCLPRAVSHLCFMRTLGATRPGRQGWIRARGTSHSVKCNFVVRYSSMSGSEHKKRDGMQLKIHRSLGRDVRAWVEG